ncbi:hypothetical protein IMG5_050800, partial [Ichthyophthirius multifiliis]
MTKILLEKGADINKKDCKGITSFIMSCHWNTKELGFNINPTFTVLIKSNYNMAKYLLDKGANIDNIMKLHFKESNIKLNEEQLEFIE